MTGPSLADLWGRKAGGSASFLRYSSALKSSGVVWNDTTLNDWIKDPQHLILGNDMTFQAIKNDQQRTNLLAFLKDVTRQESAPSSRTVQQGGGMDMGMMGGRESNLKTLDAASWVQAISYCGDTYRVTTADGKARAFWERNLRLMTDSSDRGRQQGAPALVPAGMMGDRADAIFAAPEEISGFIKHEC